MNKEFLVWVVFSALVGFITLLTVDAIGIDDKLTEVIILAVVYIIYILLARKLMKKK